MRHLSLFSGVGGIDLGFDRAGMETVGQVEWDASARTVLERHWPGVPRWEDVNDVHAQSACLLSDGGGTRPDVRPTIAATQRGNGIGDSVTASGADNGGTCDRCLSAFDVLSGGFPCQDISVAGKRAGLAGNRSGLWYQFARIIAETSPRWVVIENVPGLLSSNSGRDMGAILGTLGDYGYGWAYRVLDAQWFGVAQRRRRVFIVGHLGGDGACEVLAVGQGSAGDSPPRRTEGEGTAVAVAGRPDLSSSAAGTIGQRGNRSHSELDGHGAHVLSFNWQTGQGQYEPNEHTSGTLHKGQVPAIAWDSLNHSASDLVPTMSQNTGTATGRAGVVHTTQVRRLTPTECARLQGFPDDFNDHLSDTQRYRQYGNAVCVNVAEWVGRRIMEVEHGLHESVL